MSTNEFNDTVVNGQAHVLEVAKAEAAAAAANRYPVPDSARCEPCNIDFDSTDDFYTHLAADSSRVHVLVR